MADNYLERKMEELRSGRLDVKKAIPGIKPKASRIVVAGGCHGVSLEKALGYRREGHRVAVFDDDEPTGRRLAHDNGIRFHRVSPSDHSAIKKEIHNLLSTWRGIDQIAGNQIACDIMADAINEWKENLPIPDKSTLDIVII